jgi:hypothetical protein
MTAFSEIVAPSPTQRQAPEAGPDRSRAGRSLYGLLVCLVPVLAHLFFSSLGFNPTDDGFILAYSRRMLDGQVPHRDFISIRPIGSALLHSPFVLLGGDYTYWIDRLAVWCEFAVIAWAWVAIITRCARIDLTRVERFALYLIAFMFSTHIYAIMAWHTVDGLFLVSAGLLLCMRETTSCKLIGYAVIGTACLCKQNFAVMGPACLVLLGDWRRPRYWAAVLTPPLLYTVYLLAMSALPNAILQLGAQSDLVRTGVTRYLTSGETLVGLLTGCVLGLAVSWTRGSGIHAARRGMRKLLGMIGASGVLLYCALALGVGGTIAGDTYSEHASFVLLGAVVGATVYLLIARRQLSGPARAGALAAVTAWSASISIGYNNPALMGGSLAIVLLAYAQITGDADDATRRLGRLRTVLLGTVLVLTVVKYGIAREQHIYLEQPAAHLTYALDGVFPGGRLLRTNRNTYDFLRDLQRAVLKTKGQPYAIVPECSGYWAKAAQLNPLPIDWPQSIELNKPALVNRVIRDVEAHRGKLVFIVQRVSAYMPATGYVPLEDSNLTVMWYVRRHFTRIAKTRFFDLYV